ncbi:MAG: hypothetical protein JWM96_932, partial [Alphaproteobacteria bacterium]|nr:hypothetical protein [Alphaproteobacteria bacterium]
LDLTPEITAAGISEEEAAQALIYGLMAVEEHVDCLIVDSLSQGSDTILQNWHSELLKENAAEPLALLQSLGAGHDLFALLGAVLAARMAGIPVFGGAKLGAVLPLVLSHLLPGETDIFLLLPAAFPAPDMVQAIMSLQQLQSILALGPQNSGQKLVQPQNPPLNTSEAAA